MEEVTFDIPAMWADHHTLAVRQVLGQVEGVQEVVASPLYKDVLIVYDSEAVSPVALAQVLTEAGYEPGKAPELPAHPERIEDASDWFQFQKRTTVTDGRDLEMSGDHRKY